MSNHADERQNIIADLQSWIRQNRSVGAEWYLDEGDRPKVIPVPAKVPAPVEVETAVTPPTPPKPQASAAVPSPPPANDKEAAFQVICDKFVTDTLVLIKRQHEASPVVPPREPLLTEHGNATTAMAALRAEVMPCTACELSGSRNTVVFGSGNPEADVVFVGEAPGRDEDLQGEPFVGASGQLLTKILGAIGFAREDVFICNILKCRPPNNRDPQPAEVQQCEPHLQRQLAILRPRVICCLGRVAAQTLLKTDLSLGKLRRTVHFYTGIPVMVTFHPAALLRNPSWKRDTWDDVRKMSALSNALRAEEI